MSTIAETMEPISTDEGDIAGLVRRAREGFRSHKTLSIEYRLQQLKKLKLLIEENEDRLMQALHSDLHKCETEAVVMELDFITKDIQYTMDNLEEWMRPRHLPRGLANIADKVYTVAEPYGVVLVIAPWNYPVQLCLLPVVGAIAAGNACVIKPSEVSVATSNLLAELIPRYLDNECYQVVTGGVPVCKALLRERFDYIIYTGNSNVGKVVMEHAAKHLTPVTLELGGKSPAIIVDDADIKVAAQRIIWGKCLNAGQTCISPDYVLCPSSKVDQFVDLCKQASTKYFGFNPKLSSDFGRIINNRHFKRVMDMLSQTKGRVVMGGDSDEEERYIAPTIVTGVTSRDSLMEDEIFGPILPVIAIDTVDEAIEFVNKMEKPLSFYVFTSSGATFKKINRLTSAGGVVHNDVLMHASVLSLPFGGVGESGMGTYHFKYSYETFSHMKPVLQTGTALEALNQLLRVPPYTKTQMRRVRWVLSPPRKRNPWLTRLLFFSLVALLGVVLAQRFQWF